MAPAFNTRLMTTECKPECLSLSVLSKALQALSSVIGQPGHVDLNMCREAHAKLKHAHDAILAYDRGLNAIEIAPEGTDYNHVLSFLED